MRLLDSFAAPHIVIRDYAISFNDNLAKAEEGNARAQSDLGVMYGLGLGCRQDYACAVRWYRRAAEQAYAPAQSNLGFMFGTGRGVPQDFVQAYAWYNLAAAGGEELARANRDLVAARMTPGQLERAQDLSRDLFARHQPDQAQP